MTAIEFKKHLRNHFRLNDEICQQSLLASIKQKLVNWSIYQSATKMAFYLAMRDEVALDDLFESEKELFLPRFNVATNNYEMAQISSPADLKKGKFGIKEPSDTCRSALKNEINLWLIPGIAFDRDGNRLGRGRGFYDRILAAENGVKVGVCHAGKIVEAVPFEEHDVKMDFVLTDIELIRTKRS